MCSRISIALMAAVLFVYGPSVVVQARGADDRVPKGLSPSDWSGIRGAYEANCHAAFAVEGGYQVRNPGQQWRTRFDGRGFETTPDAADWSWGLELVSYGRGDQSRDREGAGSQSRCMEANGGRVSYKWDDNLTEWYVNDARGMEHGYTVRESPAGSAALLHFTLAVRGGLRPQVSGDGRGVIFVDMNGAAVVNYTGLTVFDATGVTVPSWFEMGNTNPKSEIRNPQFLSIVVDDREALYPLTIDPIAQQAYLKASNTGASDQFGYSVAVSGDTVVVGAVFESSSATGVNGNQGDNSAMNAGAAYVFVRSGTTWSQQAYLKASNTGASDQFAISVAVSGDTVVVGAVAEDSAATGVNGDQADNSAGDSGAAYVFVRTGTTWSQQAYLKASNTGAGDQFGVSVAVSVDTVVIGANQEASSATGVNGNEANNSASQSGAAYVFVRTGTTWSQQAYLKASNTGSTDFFGISVAVSGDTAVIGAFFEDSNATGVNGNGANNSAASSGAAYVFLRTGTTWSQQAYLKASNTGAGDQFGNAVSLSGDTVVVGAQREASNATGVNGDETDNSAANSGAAYVFVRGGTTWTQQAYLKASNSEAGDVFGWAVAVSGDTVVVGAPAESSSATGVNGNGADNSAVSSGAAYVFVRSGGVWSQLAYLKASNTEMIDGFGNSVAVSGDTVAVGAPTESSGATGINGNQADNSESGSGAVYLFAVDTDGDGLQDSLDNCPSVANAGQADFDGDGIGDDCDGCPTDLNKIAPGVCGCGVPDTDTDNDGTLDCNDGCPDDPGKTAPRACGCGVSDADSDGDGTPNCNDGCPNDPAKTAAGTCGCGVSDADSDGDETPDCNDGCPNDLAKTAAGACGCGRSDADANGNGTPDCLDLPATSPAPCGACGPSASAVVLSVLGLYAMGRTRCRRPR